MVEWSANSSDLGGDRAVSNDKSYWDLRRPLDQVNGLAVGLPAVAVVMRMYSVAVRFAMKFP